MASSFSIDQCCCCCCRSIFVGFQFQFPFYVRSDWRCFLIRIHPENIFRSRAHISHISRNLPIYICKYFSVLSSLFSLNFVPFQCESSLFYVFFQNFSLGLSRANHELCSNHVSFHASTTFWWLFQVCQNESQRKQPKREAKSILLLLLLCFFSSQARDPLAQKRVVLRAFGQYAPVSTLEAVDLIDLSIRNEQNIQKPQRFRAIKIPIISQLFIFHSPSNQSISLPSTVYANSARRRRSTSLRGSTYLFFSFFPIYCLDIFLGILLFTLFKAAFAVWRKVYNKSK